MVKTGHMTGRIIAIDGTAASGKGTLARRLASHYGLPYLDTGLLYRYAGVEGLRRGVDIDDADASSAHALQLAKTLTPDMLADPAYRGAEAGPAASRVSRHPGVRQAMYDLQRDFGLKDPEGAVLDGRDIGTVIFPEAKYKFFVTATPEIRAQRRWKELSAAGDPIAYDSVLADMLERDRRDAERETAPMKAAEDALILDTSDMTVEEVMAFAIRHIGKP